MKSLQPTWSFVIAILLISWAMGCSASEKIDDVVDFSIEIIGYSPSEVDRQLAEELLRNIKPDVPAIAAAARKQKDKFAEATHSLDNSSKFRLLLVYFCRLPVPRGLTDDGLKFRVKEGRLKKQISAALNVPVATTCLEVLDDMEPEKLKDMVRLLAGCYYTGQNPYSPLETTWAAESLAEVTRDIMITELVRHSVAAKLLAIEGHLKLPEETTAVFKWSGMPSIDIPLSVRLSASDTPRLRALLNSRHEYYREAAEKALYRFSEGQTLKIERK